MQSPPFQRHALLAAIMLLAGCTTAPERRSNAAAFPSVTAFSEFRAGAPIPEAWQPWSLSRFKPRSRYQLIEDSGTTVVKASAQASASGLIHYLDVNPRDRPLLSWRWKLTDLHPSQTSADDSPARVVVSFDGDHEKLNFSDRLFYNQFHLFTGQQLPYAALMYVWGSRTPKNGIAPNPHTSRIKIIAVESGRAKLGEWLHEQRDVAADFRLAFGEEPGKIISVGILTETEISDRTLEAYYGDFAFHTLQARQQ